MQIVGLSAPGLRAVFVDVEAGPTPSITVLEVVGWGLFTRHGLPAVEMLIRDEDDVMSANDYGPGILAAVVPAGSDIGAVVEVLARYAEAERAA